MSLFSNTEFNPTYAPASPNYLPAGSTADYSFGANESKTHDASTTIDVHSQLRALANKNSWHPTADTTVPSGFVGTNFSSKKDKKKKKAKNNSAKSGKFSYVAKPTVPATVGVAPSHNGPHTHKNEIAPPEPTIVVQQSDKRTNRSQRFTKQSQNDVFYVTFPATSAALDYLSKNFPSYTFVLAPKHDMRAHPHGTSALERKLLELHTVRRIRKNSPEIYVVLQGGSPFRLVGTSNLHFCNPVLTNNDVGRNYREDGVSATHPHCEHSIIDCDCLNVGLDYGSNKACIYVHQYHLDPIEIRKTLLQSKSVYGIFHRFDGPFGKFWKIDRNNYEATWERFGSDIIMKTIGNIDPYVHNNIDWLETACSGDVYWKIVDQTQHSNVYLFMLRENLIIAPKRISMSFDDAINDTSYVGNVQYSVSKEKDKLLSNTSWDNVTIDSRAEWLSIVGLETKNQVWIPKNVIHQMRGEIIWKKRTADSFITFRNRFKQHLSSYNLPSKAVTECMVYGVPFVYMLDVDTEISLIENQVAYDAPKLSAYNSMLDFVTPYWTQVKHAVIKTAKAILSTPIVPIMVGVVAFQIYLSRPAPKLQVSNVDYILKVGSYQFSLYRCALYYGMGYLFGYGIRRHPRATATILLIAFEAWWLTSQYCRPVSEPIELPWDKEHSTFAFPWDSWKADFSVPPNTPTEVCLRGTTFDDNERPSKLAKIITGTGMALLGICMASLSITRTVPNYFNETYNSSPNDSFGPKRLYTVGGELTKLETSNGFAAPVLFPIYLVDLGCIPLVAANNEVNEKACLEEVVLKDHFAPYRHEVDCHCGDDCLSSESIDNRWKELDPTIWSHCFDQFAEKGYTFPQDYFPKFREWNSRFPKSKQTRHVIAKSFVDSNYLDHNTIRKIVKKSMFIKCEKMLKSSDYDHEPFVPRPIMETTDVYQVLVGPYMWDYGKALAQCFNGNNTYDIDGAQFNIVYASGMTYKDIGDWFEKLPDNVTFFYHDARKFDVTIVVNGIKYEHSVYSLASLPSKILHVMNQQINAEGYTRNGDFFAISGKRHSGDPNTACGNFTLNGGVNVNILQENKVSKAHLIILGDDIVIAIENELVPDNLKDPDYWKLAYAKFGLICKPNISQNIFDVEFCSSKLVPTREGLCLTPLFHRVFAKLGWSYKPIKDTQQHLRSVILGLYNDMNHHPLWYIVQSHVLNHTEDKIDIIDESTRNRLSNNHCCETNMDTMAWLEGVYGITGTHLLDFQEYIGSLDMSSFAQPVSHFVLDRTRQVDVTDRVWG